jgi:hypothetical protein
MHCGVEVTESSTNKQHHLSSLVPGDNFCRYGESPEATASGGHTTAASSFSTDTASHTHTDCSTAPHSPTTPRSAHSPTAFSGPIAQPPPSPAHAPCSHPQAGPPDSTTSPVIVLYTRALCARLCVLELPPSPAGFRIWVSTSSSPPHTDDEVFCLFLQKQKILHTCTYTEFG